MWRHTRWGSCVCSSVLRPHVLRMERHCDEGPFLPRTSRWHVSLTSLPETQSKSEPLGTSRKRTSALPPPPTCSHCLSQLRAGFVFPNQEGVATEPSFSGAFGRTAKFRLLSEPVTSLHLWVHSTASGQPATWSQVLMCGSHTTGVPPAVGAAPAPTALTDSSTDGMACVHTWTGHLTLGHRVGRKVGSTRCPPTPPPSRHFELTEPCPR